MKVFLKMAFNNGSSMMAREKKSLHKVQMTEGKRNIIQMLLQEYDIESAQDI